ncbi:MAG TPA: large conductance mechanosensitive channel protein MscL [Gaiellales bacterium]|nr:large conductance mechanosensitive channel protein MscL [Gaiellales bacterium]
MIREFRQFLFRGNIVELAVAVVIGTAFVALVNAFIADILTPLVAAVFGKPDFSSLSFHINGSTFRYGSFLNALFTFFTVALVIFFLVVKPMNALTARTRPEDEEPATRECPECLSVIPGAARRCSHCTSQVTPVTAT